MSQRSLASFFGGGTKAVAAAVVVTEDADEPQRKKARFGEVETPVKFSETEAAMALSVTPMATSSKDPQGSPADTSVPRLPPLPDGEQDWLPLEPSRAGCLPAAWMELLSSELRKSYFTQLRKFVNKEADKHPGQIFPPAAEVFSAFTACDPASVRVVIIGQDPYHDNGQAHGLAFSVKQGVSPLPPSLQNMLKEIRQDPALPDIPERPRNGCLTAWAKQGVLLLNTCLTVRAHQANSHQKQGWEQFTDAVVRALGERYKDLVFLLWGLPAHQKGALVTKFGKTKHVIIKSSHPSPLAATRPSAGNPAFMGSRCFSKCNDELLKRNRGPAIDWTVPETA
uniref:Uracil-DNA glycosylase n=1 Tax=Crypthecodinium cohnii TaxID=2866 RepID=A0A516AGS3_CRYCO|nr:uracil-DNA glycosylase [Crypthecodinium cohnii]USW07801.1 uracil-DNA glycosylase [Crypthecodinium cohnii]